MALNIKLIKPRVDFLTPIEELSTMEKKIEIAGRTCYKSEEDMTDESSGKFVKKILKLGHESVIEHCSITVRFICSRTTSHQLVRHRIAAYSQESQRYCNYAIVGADGSALQVIPPIPVIESGDDLLLGYDKNLNLLGPAVNYLDNKGSRVWLSNCRSSYQTYLDCLGDGWRPEDARENLLNCVKTEVVTTYNLRTWRWFFEKRCDKHAQKPIRILAKDVLREFNKHLPNVFGDQAEKFLGKE